MSKPRLLDLFCGAGGCAKGYQRAGFYVVGVDHKPQPRYCGDEFIQADAMTFPLEGFDVIHASPPCQHASTLRAMHRDREYPALIEPTRNRLMEFGGAWIIENVCGADLIRPMLLCGSMFGLGALCADGVFHQLRRHRLFECSHHILRPGCKHVGRPVGVYGNGGGNANRGHLKGVNGFTGKAGERREAMKIDWMTRGELSQAIPPAYTEYIGKQLIARLSQQLHKENP